jgi:hypothetical protein
VNSLPSSLRDLSSPRRVPRESDPLEAISVTIGRSVGSTRSQTTVRVRDEVDEGRGLAGVQRDGDAFWHGVDLLGCHDRLVAPSGGREPSREDESFEITVVTDEGQEQFLQAINE